MISVYSEILSISFAVPQDAIEANNTRVKGNTEADHYYAGKVLP